MLVGMTVLVLFELCVLDLPLVPPKLSVDVIPIVRLGTHVSQHQQAGQTCMQMAQYKAHDSTHVLYRSLTCMSGMCRRGIFSLSTRLRSNG